MEIASTCTNLNMFPTDQRYNVGCKSTTSSFLRRNPKFRPDGCDVVMETTKKRKYSDEEKPPEKRQRKTIQSKFTESVDTKPITAKFTKPFQSCTTSKTRLHVTETEKSKVITTENQDHSFKDLIAKAREKVQEKRQIDHRNTDIASQRIAARLALNQMVVTFDFDDHLKYHMELENLGCDFISDQVSCLKKFDLLTRSDYYIDESNSE